MDKGKKETTIPVFVGSTYKDLKEHRREVREALVRLKMIVRGMEYFGSQPDSPVEECLREVRSCKIYIGIFGMRYGSIPDGYEKSMTHLEYEEAQKFKLPSLIYLIDEKKSFIHPMFVDLGEKGKKLKELKDELKNKHLLQTFKSPENLAAMLYHDVPNLLKRMSKDMEEDQNLLKNSDSTRLDVFATFGLAKSGDPQARSKLLEWCADKDSQRQKHAATILAELDDSAVYDLIEETKHANVYKDLNREKSLILALSYVLRRKEEVEPRTLGQKWLRNLPVELRERVKKTYVTKNLEEARKDLWPTFLWYANLTGFLAGLGSLPCSVFGANVLWRTSISPTALSKFVAFFFASMMGGLLGGGLLSITCFYGRHFERPRRFLMISLVGTVGFFLSAVIAFGFAQTQGRGVLEEILGPTKTVILLSKYFVTLMFLVSVGFITCFVAKEIPAVRRRLPSPLFSIVTMPTVVTVLAALTIPFFMNTELKIKELTGELLLIFIAVLGSGIADYLLDLRNLRKEIGT